MTGGSEMGAKAAALAAVAEVRAHLERLVADARTEAAGEVEKLGARVDKLTAGLEAAGPAPFWFDDLEPDEAQQRWAELEQWVAGVLRAHHPRQAQALRDCWAEHAAARAAVAAAWFAWVGAYRSTNRRGSDPASWMRDWLPALVRQLHDELGDDPYRPCPMGHDQRRPT